MNTATYNSSVNVMTVTQLKDETKVNNRDVVNSACTSGKK